MPAIRRDDLTGKRLQCSGAPTVWLIIDGERRLIPNAHVYDQLFGSNVEDVVPFERIEEIQAGPDLIAETRLIQDESDARIYLVTGPNSSSVRRHHIESYETFVAFGFEMSRVVSAPRLLLDRLEIGGPLRSGWADGVSWTAAAESQPPKPADDHEPPSRVRLSVGMVVGDARHDVAATCERVSRSVDHAVRRLNDVGVTLEVTRTALLAPSVEAPADVPPGWRFAHDFRAAAGVCRGQNVLMKGSLVGASAVDWHLIVDQAAWPDIDCVYELLALALSRPDAGMVEASLFPREPARAYNPVTLDTPWCATQCTLISAAAFAGTQGFDTELPERLHDVDLSWRVRRLGYATKTARNAVCGSEWIDPADDPDHRRVLTAGRKLGLKWGAADFVAWVENRMGPEGQSAEAPKASRPAPLKRSSDNDFEHGFDFGPPRWRLPSSTSVRHVELAHAIPEVSVVVRTHRPDRAPLLRRALWSLALQQGVRIEAVIVTQGFAEAELKDVEVLVDSLSDPKGALAAVKLVNVEAEHEDLRARLLNQGLAASSSRYLAFLDDDDLMYRSAYRSLVGDLIRSGAAVAVGRCDRVDGEMREGRFVALGKSRPFVGGGVVDLVADNFCPIHSFVVDRERAPADALTFDEDAPYLEDYRFLLRLAASSRFTFCSMNEDVCEYWFYRDGINTTAQSSNRYSAVGERYRRAYAITEQLKGRLEIPVSMIDLELWAKTRLAEIGRSAGLSAPFADPTDVTIDVARQVADRLRLSPDLLG